MVFIIVIGNARMKYTPGTLWEVFLDQIDTFYDMGNSCFLTFFPPHYKMLFSPAKKFQAVILMIFINIIAHPFWKLASERTKTKENRLNIMVPPYLWFHFL